MSELFDRVRAHAENDVDDEDRATLLGLLQAAEGGDAEARDELEARFSGPLTFGTAGLRGLLGAGETRMNRAVVTRATYGLLQHLIEAVPDAKARGIVVGRDGRHGSAAFQRDVAEVAAGLGVTVHFIEGTSPTPQTAFGVRHLRAAAGVVVTASHNPPAYNGYKVYWDNGAQIVSPTDAHIAAQIEAAPAANEVPRLDFEAARAQGRVNIAALDAPYLEALSGSSYAPGAPVSDLVVAYSAMHGVGESLLRRAFAARGIGTLHSVAAQAEPDGDFPTVNFPNPEEPGALDLVTALAEAVSADVVLVNDPDADRLGVAAKDAAGRFVPLTGNEIGVLLADHVLRRKPAGIYVTTIVSSRLLSKMATAVGARYAETPTGFKWIANEAMRIEAETGAEVALGYEEALGYTVGAAVRDKDGIGAALVMAELVAELKAEGRGLFDRLEEIWRTHGLFVSRPKSVTLPGADGAARIQEAMRRLREAGLTALPEAESLWDLSTQTRVYRDGREEAVARWSGDVLIFELDCGGRVAVRPSGTEPKAKFYLEVAEAMPEGAPLPPALEAARARLDRIEAHLLALSGLLDG